jgi:hypothetical protein
MATTKYFGFSGPSLVVATGSALSTADAGREVFARVVGSGD